jgi:type IV fimbrial biogenesis protein FimT
MSASIRGFNLIELAVSLTIAAAVMAIALPSLSQFRSEARMRSASHQLGTSLAMARQFAVNQGRPFSVCPALPGGPCRADGIWDGGWIVFRDTARTGRPASRDDILQSVVPAAGVTVRTSPGRSNVRFLPLGNSPGTNLTITVCSRQAPAVGARVVLSNSGRVRTERVPRGHPDCVAA